MRHYLNSRIIYSVGSTQYRHGINEGAVLAEYFGCVEFASMSEWERVRGKFESS